MRLLVDTSASTLHIGLWDHEALVAQTDLPESRQSKMLLAGVKDFLSLQNLKIGDIGELAICIGPGSYTGLRVGLTFAKVWAFARNLKLYSFQASVDGLSALKEKDFVLVTDIDKLEPIYTNDHFSRTSG